MRHPQGQGAAKPAARPASSSRSQLVSAIRPRSSPGSSGSVPITRRSGLSRWMRRRRSGQSFATWSRATAKPWAASCGARSRGGSPSPEYRMTASSRAPARPRAAPSTRSSSAPVRSTIRMRRRRPEGAVRRKRTLRPSAAATSSQGDRGRQEPENGRVRHRSPEYHPLRRHSTRRSASRAAPQRTNRYPRASPRLRSCAASRPQAPKAAAATRRLRAGPTLPARTGSPPG